MNKLSIILTIALSQVALANGQSGNRPPFNNRGGSTNDTFKGSSEKIESTKSRGGGVGAEAKSAK